MNIIKQVDKTLKKSLKTAHIRLISAIILIYIIIARPTTAGGVFHYTFNHSRTGVSTSILDHPLLKICMSLMVIYISTWDIISAVILLLVYILILHDSSKKNIDTFVTDFIITQKNIDNMKNQLSNITNWIEHTMNNLGKKIFSAADITTVTTATATTLTPLKVKPATESIIQPTNVAGFPPDLPECDPQSTRPCTLSGKLYKDKKEIGSCSNPDWADNNDANAMCYDEGVIYNKNLEMYDKASNTFKSSF